MRASSYAKALHRALADDPTHTERLLKQFVQTVFANGHQHLFPKIVRSFSHLAGKDAESQRIEVVSAVPLTEEEVVAILKKEPFNHALTQAHKRVERITDTEIIGGVIVRSKSLRIDASDRGSLLDMYHECTARI